MGKGGKCLQIAEMEIKYLRDCNHELQNKVEILEWKLKQSQTLINQMTSTLEAVKDFQIEREVKEKLIHALQIKLNEKKDLLDAQCVEKTDASCDTEELITTTNESCDSSDLIQHINKGCNIDDLIKQVDISWDTHELIKQVDISCDTSDLIQPLVLLNDATSSTKDQIDQFDTTCQTNELLMLDGQCDTKGLINQEQNVSNNIKYEEKQEDGISKKLIRPWEEISFNKHRHDLGYNSENTLFIPDFKKLVQFVSVGFLNNDQNMVKCNHCK